MVEALASPLALAQPQFPALLVDLAVAAVALVLIRLPLSTSVQAEEEYLAAAVAVAITSQAAMVATPVVAVAQDRAILISVTVVTG